MHTMTWSATQCNHHAIMFRLLKQSSACRCCSPAAASRGPGLLPHRYSRTPFLILQKLGPHMAFRPFHGACLENPLTNLANFNQNVQLQLPENIRSHAHTQGQGGPLKLSGSLMPYRFVKQSKMHAALFCVVTARSH